MASRSTGQINVRVAPAEITAWRAKAAAAGVPPSDLLRQAIARTRTWTAAAVEVERKRRAAGRFASQPAAVHQLRRRAGGWAVPGIRTAWRRIAGRMRCDRAQG